jgi:tetratricopeptide (TPR) repeat protein
MEDLALLLDRFLDFKRTGQFKYFDVDDILSLIEYFTDTDDAENLNSAIDLAYELYPDNLELKIKICGTIVYLEDYETAIKLLEEIEVQGNKEVDLLYIECLCELSRKDEALDFLKQLREEGALYVEDVVVYLACILNDIDEYRNFAYDFIIENIKTYPDNFELQIELCHNFELQGKIREALDKCDELLDTDSYSAEVWFMKGRLYATCSDFVKAVEALDYAQSSSSGIEELDELTYEILLLKAQCFCKNENYYKAIDVYEELLSMEDIDKSQIEPLLAESLINVEEYERAFYVLKNHISDPDYENSISVSGNYILCCLETDRNEEALEELNEALKLFHRNIIDYIASIYLLQSNIYDMENDSDVEKYLVDNLVNSNLHVN